MSAKASQVRIGIFVVSGLAVLAAALFFFGIRSAFEPTYRLETYVTGRRRGPVQGIRRQAARGRRRQGDGDRIQLEALWRHASPMCGRPVHDVAGNHAGVRRRRRRGRVATVRRERVSRDSSGGGNHRNEHRGASDVWTRSSIRHSSYLGSLGTTYVPSAPSQFGQILASLNRTLANLAALDVAKIGASADRALNSADATFRKLGELDTPGISRNVNRAAVNASDAIREYGGLASDARRTLQAMQLEKVGPDADRLVNNLDRQLQELIARLNAVDVQALNDTLAGTREAARNLNDALEALRADPSGFLFGGAPRPVPGIVRVEK